MSKEVTFFLRERGSGMVKSVLVYLLLGVSSEAFYVSYETKNQYLLGDR